jgi:hypothetical protein
MAIMAPIESTLQKLIPATATAIFMLIGAKASLFLFLSISIRHSMAQKKPPITGGSNTKLESTFAPMWFQPRMISAEARTWLTSLGPTES